MARLTTNSPMRATTVSPGRIKARLTEDSYQSRSLLNPRLNAALNLFHGEAGAGSAACPCSCEACGRTLRKREQNNGMTVIATTNEIRRERQKERARAVNRNLLTP